MKYILFIFLFSIFSYGEPATKDDIKILINYMDKRFDDVNQKFNFR